MGVGKYGNTIFTGSTYDTTGNSGGAKSNNGMMRIVLARHSNGKAINVAFVDGHAETVMLPDLWNLQWHQYWNQLGLATWISNPAHHIPNYH